MTIKRFIVVGTLGEYSNNIFNDYYSFFSGVAVAIMLISVSPFQEPSLMQEIVGKAESGQRKLNLL